MRKKVDSRFFFFHLTVFLFSSISLNEQQSCLTKCIWTSPFILVVNGQSFRSGLCSYIYRKLHRGHSIFTGVSPWTCWLWKTAGRGAWSEWKIDVSKRLTKEWNFISRHKASQTEIGVKFEREQMVRRGLNGHKNQTCNKLIKVEYNFAINILKRKGWSRGCSRKDIYLRNRILISQNCAVFDLDIFTFARM